jgi:predicted metal-dependent hydrolase
MTGVAAQPTFMIRWWFRDAIPALLAKWGSCTPESGYIRLNTGLAKEPPVCLEYILVHELVHMLEPTHNERFVALMDKCLPHWQHLRKRLNGLPVRHENWD